MVKLRNSRNLDARQALLVDNAYYAVHPPERVGARRKRRPPMHEYMRHLILDSLSKDEVKPVRRSGLLLRAGKRGWHMLCAASMPICYAQRALLQASLHLSPFSKLRKPQSIKCLYVSSNPCQQCTVSLQSPAMSIAPPHHSSFPEEHALSL